MGKGIGGHHQRSPAWRTWGTTDEWLTPPWILEALGPFALDPCAPIVRPWDMAARHYTVEDDGLRQPWEGRVWLNPPYGRRAAAWLKRMDDYGNGIVLMFARTETEMFHESVWGCADGILFMRGRIDFYLPDGTKKGNAGGPSVLIAYGPYNAGRLRYSRIPGAYVDLRQSVSVTAGRCTRSTPTQTGEDRYEQLELGADRASAARAGGDA